MFFPVFIVFYFFYQQAINKMATSTSDISEAKQPCAEYMDRSAILLESGQFSDCSFLVGPLGSDPELIPGCKPILALTSPVFEVMFYGSMEEKNDPITIPDVNPGDFKVLLKYMYTDKIDICSLEQASGLYYCAKKFLLPHLQQKCSEYLMKLTIVPGNACQIYEYAELFEENELKVKATEKISKDTKLILKDPSFNKITLSTLLYIFSLDKLNIDSELELLEAAVRYSEAQEKLTAQNETVDKSELPVQRAIEKIRFLTLTPTQFAESRTKTCLLTDTEVMAIIMNIASSNTEIPYPSRLCKNRNPRHKYYSSSALITLTIKDFKCFDGTVSSKSTNALNFSWRIWAKPHLHHEKKKKYLTAYIYCRSTKSSNWKCNCEFELKLLSQTADQNICIHRKEELTNKLSVAAWYLASWEEVLDPSKEFIQNGAVTIEVLTNIIDCFYII